MTETDRQSVHVALGDRSYDVEVGVDLLRSLGERVRAALHGDQTGETPIPLSPSQSTSSSSTSAQLGELCHPANSSRAFVVIDDNLPHSFTASALQSLDDAGFNVTSERIVALETNKTLETVERLLVQVAATHHERGEPIIALGGGIVGDVAGFVAASYRRGVPVIQCPTTLLAMVDASVGGKTGVNLRVNGSLLKNMAGAFWQPRLVLADIAALRSLPDRQFRSGLAECIKHTMICRDLDADLHEWTAAAIHRLHCRDETALAELVSRNVAVKAGIVECDEREESASSGGRALLNLGHTFAHAIETIPHLSPDDDPSNAPLLHGEAVALGLIAAAACSQEIGLIDQGHADQITQGINAAGLPTQVANLPPTDDLLLKMLQDKKVTGSQIRLVLPKKAGPATVTDAAPESAIRRGFDAIRAQC